MVSVGRSQHACLFSAAVHRVTQPHTEGNAGTHSGFLAGDRLPKGLHTQPGGVQWLTGLAAALLLLL